jgi:hypothetical protein
MTLGLSMAKRLLVAGGLVSLLLCEPVGAELQRFVVGNSSRPWSAWGSFDAVDDQTAPGWVQPKRTTLAANILNELFKNGQLYAGTDPPDRAFRLGKDGRIWSINLPIAENRNLLWLADGLTDTLSFDYFNRLASNAGVSIVVDLGVPYPVSDISFYPLSLGAHVDQFVKGYELYANDGSPTAVDERGEPLFALLEAVPTNMDVVVRSSRFIPQHMRYIKLRITSPQAFELDQMEIRGEGYVRRAVFTSQIIDLGDIANLGRICWATVQDPGSWLTVQTRLGRDRNTLVYHRISELEGVEEELRGNTDEENLQVYESLPEVARGSIAEDTENWTPWSVPYDSSGQALLSTGPRQFVQIRVNLESGVTTGRTRVDSVGFDFSRPTMARRAVGQIEPRLEVNLGSLQTFTYTVRADIGADDLGFDTIEIVTPTTASVEGVRVRGRPIPEEGYELHTDENSFSVRLRNPLDRVSSSGDQMEIVFTTHVLVYGTVFEGRVSAHWQDNLLPQLVEEQRVGDLTVRGSERSLGRVLGGTMAVPGVFTPNGDGSNDTAVIVFQLFQVIGEAPLRVQVFDVAGRLVATLLDRPAASNTYRVEWKGTDGNGQRVAPGLYLYRVSLVGDAASFVEIGTVGVVY